MFKGSLKKMLAEKQVLSPCVWDCMSTKAVEMCGYDAVLLAGGPVAKYVLGYPDLGIMTIDELVWVTERVANYATVPVLIDADEGYGDSPLNVARNIERLVKAGARGFTLDDGMGIRGYARLERTWMRGSKEKPYNVWPTEHWLAKVKAALDVIEGTDCVLIARTECRPVLGLDEAIERCRRAQDLGATMTLVNRFYNIDECKKAAKIIDGWKMYPDVVIQPDGSPEVELDDIYELGFNYVTMHYLEKGALWGMLDYGKKNFANRTTVYSETHTMGDLTAEEKKIALCDDGEYWLDKENVYYQYVKDHM